MLPVAPCSSQETGNSLPIFDAHIHYSKDVWQAIPPPIAIKKLRQAGIKRALVSSTSDEGTQMLNQEDPELVIPVLRPYRKFGTTRSWMYDKTVLPYLESKLELYKYAALGELHLNNEQANLPTIRGLVKLASKYNLILHVHSDAEAIEYLFEQEPKIKILWAHAGFEDSYIVQNMMKRHINLWADLSYRQDIFVNGKFLYGWDRLLTNYAERFLLGVDTYTPQRWLQIENILTWQRKMLSRLPDEVARQIAYQNGERIFTKSFREKK